MGANAVTEFFLRLFVKNHRDTENPAVRTAIGKLAGFVGIVCNALLFACKLTAGLLCGSVSIMADAVNNLTDVSSSVITLFGFRLSGRPADKDHPYGHARYEYLSALAVSAVILFLGGELVVSSVGKIIDPAPVTYSAVTYAVLAVSIALKLWMCLFARSLGRKIRSSTLLATSVDSRNDVVATTVILLCGIPETLFGWNIDGFAGLGVALFILYSGVMLAKDTVSMLLGRRADEELVRKIGELISADSMFLGMHDLMVHDYGPGQCFASVHVEVSPDESILDCHEHIDAAEHKALKELRVHLVIHCDPTERGNGDSKDFA